MKLRSNLISNRRPVLFPVDSMKIAETPHKRQYLFSQFLPFRSQKIVTFLVLSSTFLHSAGWLVSFPSDPCQVLAHLSFIVSGCLFEAHTDRILLTRKSQRNVLMAHQLPSPPSYIRRITSVRSCICTACDHATIIAVPAHQSVQHMG